MKVLFIWFICSIPLFLTVVDAQRSAVATGTFQNATADVADLPATRHESTAFFNDRFPEELLGFAWFDAVTSTSSEISGDVEVSSESRRVHQASKMLLTLNRGLRSVVRGFENPQIRTSELAAFAEAVPGNDDDLNRLGDLPVAEGIRICVSKVVAQRIADENSKQLRKTAFENFRKAQTEINVPTLDKVISALQALPLAELNDEDREQLRWAIFWKFWLPARSTRVPTDFQSMMTRQELLAGLVAQADDPSLAPVKADEVQLVDGCHAEIEALTNQIRLEEIKEEIRSGSPESWLEDVELLLGELNNSDAQSLLKLVREALLNRVISSDAPVARFEEAVSKSGELWIGTFELKNPEKPKPYYHFVSTSGQKKSYCYLSAFEETRREPFAIKAYKRLSEARKALQVAPQKKESWQGLLNEVTSLQQEKDRYLKLTMVDGLADSKLVIQSLEPLKLEELRVVCNEILSDDMWPRIERLLSSKR